MKLPRRRQRRYPCRACRRSRSTGLDVRLGQPFPDSVPAERWPRPFFGLLDELTDLRVLAIHGFAGIDGDELKHDREVVVLLDHAIDEAGITGQRIFDAGDVLASLVEMRRARRGEAAARILRSH